MPSDQPQPDYNQNVQQSTDLFSSDLLGGDDSNET